MAYELIGFVNDTVPDINAENLNHMESGIIDNDKRITETMSAVGNSGNVISISTSDATVGAINASSGNNTSASNRVRVNGKILPSYAKTDDSYLLAVFAYSKSDGTYVGALKTDGTYAKSATNLAWIKEHFFDPTYIYRVEIRKENNANLAVEEISALHIWESTDKKLVNENKAADAKVTGDEIRNIKNNIYINKVLEFEQGTISVSSGNASSSTTRIRTTVNFSKGDVFKAESDSGYSFRVYAYNPTYVGVLQTDGTFAKSSTNLETVKEYKFESDYLYKVVLLKDDDTSIIPSEMSHITFIGFTDKTLTIDGKCADAKITGDRISVLDENVQSIAVGIRNGIIETKRFGLNDFTSGKAINSSGEVVAYNRSYCTENYYEIGGEDVIVSVLEQVETSTGWYNYVFFYDEEYNYLARTGGREQKKVLASIEEEAKYFRISLTLVGIDNVELYACASGFYVEAASTPKNKWYVFGDSISAGYFSITDEEAEEKGYHITYRPAGLEGVGSVWMRDLSHNYWGYANTFFLHRELVPSAYPGQGYFKVSADGNNGISKVKNTDVSDAGLITVAWGFNDWHYNMNRGNHDLIDPSVPYPTEGYDTSQITTVNQAIWYCLGELLRKAPNAKIVVQTPMNGWLYGGDWDSWWGIGTEKSHSGTLANIHDDIVYWANYYGLQILEMTYNNSVVNRRNIKDVLLDGSHPSDPAHMQLGRHVGIALKYM